MIKADIVMRIDYGSRWGGDVHKVEQYLKHLRGKVDARLLRLSPHMALRPDAICHIVNIDRPFDFLIAMAQAKGKIVVSPIHHSLTQIRQMQAHINRNGILPTDLRERLTYLRRLHLLTPPREAIRGLHRSVKNIGDSRDPWSRIGVELDRADAVALLGQTERRDLMNDTDWRGENGHIIPNGIPETANVTPVDWIRRPLGIFIAGRIEPRKRQLEIARAAAAADVPITFAGQLAGGKAYDAAFLAEIANSRSEYLGVLSPERAVATMASARVVLAASWVEVQSQVDIQAATVGCWVVTGPSGASAEWLGAGVVQLPTSNIETLVGKAAMLASGSLPPPPTGYRQTWANAADSLYQLYRSLQNVPKGGKIASEPKTRSTDT